MGSGRLSHINDAGEARMVDISDKDATTRSATAEAVVRMSALSHQAAVLGTGPKGEVLATARIAGIMAAKRTPEAIPMCHPLLVTGAEVVFETEIEPDSRGRPGIRVLATVKCAGKTGVEMEALHAASVAALTIYDMVKALEKGMEIECIRLLSKAGGKSGDWKR